VIGDWWIVLNGKAVVAEAEAPSNDSEHFAIATTNFQSPITDHLSQPFPAFLLLIVTEMLQKLHCGAFVRNID
jgi:hypothetical protein